MQFSLRSTSLTLLALSTLGGCASLPLSERAGVETRVQDAVGAAPRSINEAATARAQRLQALFAEPLTPEAAARVAVSGNPRIAAVFGELGVARADFLAGSLPANPTLSLARLVPEHDEPDVLKQVFGIDLLGLLTLPARRQASRAGWEAAKARAVGQAILVAGAARAAMIDHIAANQQLDLMRQADATAQAALVAAEAIHAAGNSARVELDRERLFAAEVSLQRRVAETEASATRERVNAALGLPATLIDSWAPARRLAPPPTEPIQMEEIAARVLSTSLDRTQAVAALEASRALRGAGLLSSWLPGLAFEGERERDGSEWKSGLGVGLVLPLFGLGSAERLRIDSIGSMNTAQLEAVDAEIGAIARETAIRAESARVIALNYRETLLPLSQEVFAGTQLDFNAMQVGVFELLAAKRARLATGQGAIEATRAWWQAHAALDLLLNGVSPGVPVASGQTLSTQPNSPDPGH